MLYRAVWGGLSLRGVETCRWQHKVRAWLLLLEIFLWKIYLVFLFFFFYHFVSIIMGSYIKHVFPMTLQLIWLCSTFSEAFWDGIRRTEVKGCIEKCGLPTVCQCCLWRWDSTFSRGSAIQEFQMETTSKWAGALSGGVNCETTWSGKWGGVLRANHSFFNVPQRR